MSKENKLRDMLAFGMNRLKEVSNAQSKTKIRKTNNHLREKIKKLKEVEE